MLSLRFYLFFNSLDVVLQAYSGTYRSDGQLLAAGGETGMVQVRGLLNVTAVVGAKGMREGNPDLDSCFS